MLNRYIFTGTVRAGLIPHPDLYIGRIEKQKIASALISLMISCLKYNCVFLKTRSVLEVYHGSSANKEESNKNVLLYVR